jgi:hypothetical protein
MNSFICTTKLFKKTAQHNMQIKEFCGQLFPWQVVKKLIIHA